MTKVELKYWHGTWILFPFEDGPPEWPGQFYELWEGHPEHCIVYMKSESAYDKTEESALIEGAIQKCGEVGADISFMEEMT